DGRVVMFNSVPRWLQRWTLDRSNRTDPKLDFLSSLLSSRSSQTGGEQEQTSSILENNKKSLLTMSILAQREEQGHTIFDKVLVPNESEYVESMASSDTSDTKSDMSGESYSSVQEQRGRSDSVSRNSALR
ncbi:hypothetical protein BGZ59_009120, partial [Podila verticillata]